MSEQKSNACPDEEGCALDETCAGCAEKCCESCSTTTHAHRLCLKCQDEDECPACVEARDEDETRSYVRSMRL